jgi:hypothetical protein
MNNQTKQIIPDPQAVIQCLDREMLKKLDSHSTFTTNDLLLEVLSKTTASIISKERIDIIFTECKNQANYTSGRLLNEVKNALEKDSPTSQVINTLLNGTICNLLQTDGKGWQKGKLKICFEFIPEEDEPVVMSEQQAENNRSPLDDIRSSLV